MMERHPLIWNAYCVVDVIMVDKDLSQERIYHRRYGVAAVIMCVEGEVDKNFVFLILGLVHIKTLENIFRSIGGASRPVNMKYTGSVVVKPFPVALVRADPIELMCRTIQ